eukprot:3933105-Rhodomonas_salina.3
MLFVDFFRLLLDQRWLEENKLTTLEKQEFGIEVQHEGFIFRFLFCAQVCVLAAIAPAVVGGEQAEAPGAEPRDEGGR